jgi:molybdate-binding protein/transcriptional regulator with XRE-family HTH domain
VKTVAGKEQHGNRVRAYRLARGWSQADLAERSGLSRAAVSAIEIRRLVPSVAAALALASVFACSVEELFAVAQNEEPAWAWAPVRDSCRFWQASVNGRIWLYPVEAPAAGRTAHDGVWREGACTVQRDSDPRATLILASCDPAAGLLAEAYGRATGGRLLILQRSSRQALELLGRGVIHAAGVHFATGEDPTGNARLVREMLGTGFKLVHVAGWQEGLCIGSGTTAVTVGEAVAGKLRWVGRETGSAAEQCLAELLPERQRPRRQAPDHRGVAMAVRCGWADAGVCHRYVSEEAGLRFMSIREEQYDLCIPMHAVDDARVASLIAVLRSASFRKLQSELPGFDATRAGSIETIADS